VGPCPRSQLFERSQDTDVFFSKINGHCTDQSSHLEPFRESINRNYASRAQHEGAGDRELPDGTTSPHCHRVARLKLCILSSHVTGRENIREEKNFLVWEVAFDLEWSYVRKWNADILGLPSCV